MDKVELNALIELLDAMKNYILLNMEDRKNV